MKTNDLTDALLDLWVAKAEGHTATIEDGLCRIQRYANGLDPRTSICPWGLVFKPSRDWAYGGPIIERERIVVVLLAVLDRETGETREASPQWCAWHMGSDAGVRGFFDENDDSADAKGSTYLQAGMRAYVASRFGEEVPEEIAA